MEYGAFQKAYDFFNAELFAGKLPNVLVTLQRHAKAYGYFSPDRFTGRRQEGTVHELALPHGFVAIYARTRNLTMLVQNARIGPFRLK